MQKNNFYEQATTIAKEFGEKLLALAKQCETYEDFDAVCDAADAEAEPYFHQLRKIENKLHG